MKKIMIATLGISLLTGTASLFAQDSSKMSTDTSSTTSTETTGKKKMKKKKKSTMSTDTSSTMAPKQ